MNTIEFGKFIASLRNEKKLTQEELAEKLFIDKRKISRWECGMSIPDFDTLIKLSEILDVSLYELSICKRIEKEKLSRKIINKFKSIKDFKKYKLKKKILIILTSLLGVFFIFTTIYTIKFYGTVEMYEFTSNDDSYDVKGTYLKTKDYISYIINTVSVRNYNEKKTTDLNKCEYEIYDNNIRLIKFDNNDGILSNDSITSFIPAKIYNKYTINPLSSTNIYLKVECNNRFDNNEYIIKLKFTKKYDNQLF